MRQRSARGSVTILGTGLLVLVTVLALAAVDVVRAIDARGRAQASADAAALAAAQELAVPSGVDPAIWAEEYAYRNGARLLSCRCDPAGAEALVEVEVLATFVFLGADRPVRAAARAVVVGASAGGG